MGKYMESNTLFYNLREKYALPNNHANPAAYRSELLVLNPPY